MNSKVLKLIICLMIFLTLFPLEQVYAYADLTEYNTYIENLDITYKNIKLTPDELSIIEELQQNGGITYGLYEDDNSVVMIFEQISKVFDIDVTPIVYDDYANLEIDLAKGIIDFTGSMIPTEERLKLFDFTTSTHKDKIFLFIKHDDFEFINSGKSDNSRVFKVGYPNGFSLDGMLSDDFKETFNYKLIPIASVDEVVGLVKDGELDMVYGDITWYSELVAFQDYMAIDNSDYIETYFSGNSTKKGTNQELISAFNKMYVETNALIDLQNQIDNYYEDAALYALKDNYYDLLNHNIVNKIYVSEYRPYVYKEDDVYKGLFIDLIKEIFNFFDLEYEFILADDLNADYVSEGGITVAMPVFVTDETKERYNLTIPVAESNMVVITKPDSYSKYFTNVDDIVIQKVGALDYSYMHDYVEEVFLNSENVHFYDDLDSIISAIDAGEIKFGIVPYQEFNKYAIENQITHISVLSSLPLPKYSIAFGTPKTERGLNYEALLSSILSILNYSDLENKYLSTTPEIEAVYEYKNKMLNSTMQMIVYAALFAITFLSVLIYINQKRANTDYLTKLRNRRTLNAYIKVTKSKKNISIAYIDLDNFKIINDVYGHHFGDEVLIYVANELMKHSKYSRSFRIGGDEFIIVYNNKHINFNEDIKTILDKIITVEQTDIKVEGSVGNLNLETYSHLTVEDIINLVDYAMMTAKRRGKNIVIEICDDLVNDYITIRDLREALENEQYDDTIKFYLESVKKDEQIYGYCLIAKCHYKDHFISYEDIRMHMTNKLVLNKISLLVFEKLCELINYENQNSNGIQEYIYELEAENINTQTIENLTSILEKYNINPKDITLRANSKLFSGAKGTSNVKLLNQLGCRISIDFYKTNGESLLYLNYLNFSFIELDISRLLEFLKHMNLSDNDAINKELSNNLALLKVVELCNSFESAILLYTYDDKFFELVVNFLLEKINTQIYYVEKDTLILLDDYLRSFKQ